MTPELATFGATQPLGFLFLVPVVAALYYAYLRKRKLKQVIIPSFFLLKDLAREVSNRQRFIPPPRFWFELFALSMLVLCVAGLFSRGESVRYAVLVDNSLSSAYRSGNQKVLDLIKANVLTSTASLSGESVFDVYQLSPDVKRLGDIDMGAGKLRSVLDEIKPIAADDRLSEQITSFLQRGDYSGILVFTDRKIELPAEATGVKKPLSLNITGTDEAPQRENIALSSVQYEANPANSEGGALKVGVIAYVLQPIEAELVVDRLGASALSWETLSKTSVSLKPDEAKIVSVSAPTSGTLAYRVRLNVVSSARQRDQLSEDNFGYVAFHRANSTVYVVSARSLADLGIEKIRGITFKAIRPEDYVPSLSKPEAQTYLFADFLPEGLPAKNLIIVSPPKGTGGFQVGGLISAAEVSEWMTGHPLLTYIDIASLRFSKFVPLIPAVWSDTVISTSRGAAMIAGMRGQYRAVVTGFDLFPYRGRSSPTVSVLFLNMLRWASAQSLGDQSTKPFEPISLAPEVEQIARFDAAAEPALIEWSKESGKLTPEGSGVHILKLRDKSAEIKSVNFFSGHESNPRPPAEQIPSGASAASAEKKNRQIAVADYLVPLLLILFSLDALYLLLVSAGVIRGFGSGRSKRRVPA